MVRILGVLALSAAVAACGLLQGDGEVVEERADEIKISVGYDAALKGRHPERLAAEHCAKAGKRAVWYGHDRDRNLHYKCE